MTKHVDSLSLREHFSISAQAQRGSGHRIRRSTKRFSSCLCSFQVFSVLLTASRERSSMATSLQRYSYRQLQGYLISFQQPHRLRARFSPSVGRSNELRQRTLSSAYCSNPLPFSSRFPSFPSPLSRHPILSTLSRRRKLTQKGEAPDHAVSSKSKIMTHETPIRHIIQTL